MNKVGLPIALIPVVVGLVPVTGEAQLNHARQPITLSSSTMATLSKHIINQDTTFTVPLSYTQAKSAAERVFSRQSYLHYILNEYSYEGTTKSTAFHMSWRQNKKQSSLVDAKIGQVLKQIMKPHMTPLDKEFAIHNYIVLNVAYDQSYTRYTPYNALFQGMAVCQGYATLTYRMLSMAGLPVKFIEGLAQGQPHLWNEVEIGSKWYQLDTTWDDPTPDVKGRVGYQYFNLTDSAMAKDHTWKHISTIIPATTDFKSTLSKVLSTNTDPYASQIAKATGIWDGINAEVVDTNSVIQVLQQAVDSKTPEITLKFKGTSVQAAGLLNTIDIPLPSDGGRVNSSDDISTSRDEGYVLVKFKLTYAP